MRIDFSGDDNVILATDILVEGPDKDGFYDATMVVERQRIRALSRDRFIAVAYLLQAAGEHIQGLSPREQE